MADIFIYGKLHVRIMRYVLNKVRAVFRDELKLLKDFNQPAKML